VDASHAVAQEMGLPDLMLVESHYRQALLTAELDFVTDLSARIRSGSYPGVAVWRRMHELRADGVTFEEIFADPIRYLGEEARALVPDQSG
jgi:hypothetical protein